MTEQTQTTNPIPTPTTSPTTNSNTTPTPPTPSQAIFSCTFCAKPYPYKTQLNLERHIKNQHQANMTQDDQDAEQEAEQDDQGSQEARKQLEIENSVMEEAMEDQELYEELDKIGKEDAATENDVDKLKENIEKTRLVIRNSASVIKKKIEMIKDITREKNALKEKVDSLEASTSQCHECICKNEVIQHQESVIKKKEKEAKSEEKTKLELKKRVDTQSKWIQKMKDQYEQLLDDNNKLNTDVKDKDIMIKRLKEELGLEDLNDQEANKQILFGNR